MSDRAHRLWRLSGGQVVISRVRSGQFGRGVQLAVVVAAMLADLRQDLLVDSGAKP